MRGSSLAHNERNTIVANTISGSATPIDLGGNGGTPNDAGDTDVGPNTLLNFPTIDSVAGSSEKAVIKGTACRAGAGAQSTDCGGIRIDIFAVSGFKSAPVVAATTRSVAAE